MSRCIKYCALGVLACLTLVMFGQCAQAQSYGDTLKRSLINRNSASHHSVRTLQNQVAARSVSSSGVSGVNRQTYTSLFSGASGPSQRPKPFSSLQRGPAVSPYLQLNGSLDSVSDYYNIVRPQRDQERANLQQQRQLNANRQRLNQVAAQGAYNLQGDPNTPSTGHTTTYMYMGNFQTTGNYYPGVQGLEKQRIDQ